MGLVTGIVSSMLGVGGGLLIRPLLTSGFKVPEYYTSRIVRLLVLVTTVTGGATYLIARGGFDWHVFAISMLVALGGVFGFPLGAKLHTIVYDSGYAQHIHKSFAVVAIAVLANTLLNMYGHAELSRYLMLTMPRDLFSISPDLHFMRRRIPDLGGGFETENAWGILLRTRVLSLS